MSDEIKRGNGYSQTKSFSYVAKVSNEKIVQTKEILKIVNQMKNRDLFLDIGAGSGDISFHVAKKFKKSVLIEPGEITFEDLKSRAKQYKNLDLIQTNWEEFYLKNRDKYLGKFDLIIQVHVVYFLKPLKEKIEEMMDLLSPNGKLVIICPAGESKKNSLYWIRQKFLNKPFEVHPDYVDIPKMFRRIIKYYDVVSTIKLRAFEFMEKNHLSPRNMATNYALKFFVKKWYDELTIEDKKILLSYLDKYRKGDYYQIHSKQRIHILDKKSWEKSK